MRCDIQKDLETARQHGSISRLNTEEGSTINGMLRFCRVAGQGKGPENGLCVAIFPAEVLYAKVCELNRRHRIAHFKRKSLVPPRRNEAGAGAPWNDFQLLDHWGTGILVPSKSPLHSGVFSGFTSGLLIPTLH